MRGVWFAQHQWIVVLLIWISITQAMSKRPQDQEIPKNNPSTTVTTNEKGSSDAPLTFLDTLNRGKEIALAERDFTPILPETTDTAVKGGVREPSTDGFRVQCFASSQIDKVRSEQKMLESKVKYAVYIVFSAPYYKLVVGDFSKRADADNALAKLKELGYNDAWVTRSKINTAH